MRWAYAASCSLPTTSTTSLPACVATVAELVGEIAQYTDVYRLCFLRGPEGIIIGEDAGSDR
jgi:hypothetical protein